AGRDEGGLLPRRPRRAFARRRRSGRVREGRRSDAPQRLRPASSRPHPRAERGASGLRGGGRGRARRRAAARRGQGPGRGDGWVESNPDAEVRFDSGDLPGPVTIAAAVDDSRVQQGGETRLPGRQGGPSIARTRLVVTGSVLWASNQFLDNLGNRRLFANALN